MSDKVSARDTLLTAIAGLHHWPIVSAVGWHFPTPYGISLLLDEVIMVEGEKGIAILVPWTVKQDRADPESEVIAS